LETAAGVDVDEGTEEAVEDAALPGHPPRRTWKSNGLPSPSLDDW